MRIPLPIETERLLIPEFDAGDVDAMAGVHGNPEVMEHICLGVFDRDRTAAPLAAAVWGRGHTLEAARACVAAAFAHLPHRRLLAKIEPGHERSLAVAERLGMPPIETIDVDGRPHLLLVLERP